MRRNLFAIGMIGMLVITGFSACNNEFTGGGDRPKRTLTFLPGDGEGTRAERTETDGKKYKLPNETETSMTAPEKKQFSGWKDGGDGVGKVYKAGTEYAVNRNVTFIAQWEAVKTPAAPTIKELKSNSEKEITVSWDKVDDADSYNVYYKEYVAFPSTTGLKDAAKDAGKQPITDTSYTVEGLKLGFEYIFYVKAVNAAGESSYSDYKKGKTNPPADTLLFDRNGGWGLKCLLNIKDMGITSPITAGTYTFAISGTADEDIDRLAVQLIDNTKGAWKELSEYNTNMNSIKKGEPFFQVAALTVKEDADNGPEETILALFIPTNNEDENQGININTPSFIKNASWSLTKNEENQITIPTSYYLPNDKQPYNSDWSVAFNVRELGWQEPISPGTYTFTISGTANQDIRQIRAELFDTKDNKQWRSLSSNNLYDLKAGEPFFQVVTLAVDGDAEMDHTELNLSIKKNDVDISNTSPSPIIISNTSMSLTQNQENQITIPTTGSVDLKASSLGLDESITPGTYTFAIKGTSNQNIERIAAELVDNTDYAWNKLSDYNKNLHGIKAGEPFFQVIALAVDKSADLKDTTILHLSIVEGNNTGATTITYTSMSLAKNEENQITLQTAFEASDTDLTEKPDWSIDLKAADLGLNEPIYIGQTYILTIEGSLNYGFNWIGASLVYNEEGSWQALSDYSGGISSNSKNTWFREVIYLTAADAPNSSYPVSGVIVQLNLSNSGIIGGLSEPIRLSNAAISLTTQ